MAKRLSTSNLYAIRHSRFSFDGKWKESFGDPETTGIWIIYGIDKNGKSWFTLKLADYLSTFKKTLYVSAEEGFAGDFIETMKRADIGTHNKNLQFLEYTPLEELNEILSKRRTSDIIILDNATVYEEEFRRGGFKKFIDEHPNKLIILVAHEDRNLPYTAAAKLAKKLAKVIVRVQGIAAFVSGRCPGGTIPIDDELAERYHGKKGLTN